MEEVGVKLIIEGESAFFDTLNRVNKAIADLGGNASPGLTGFEKALDAATKAASDANPALNQTSKALNDTGQSAQNAAGLYQDAAGKWRNSSGQFASDAEKAAAGLDEIPDSARKITPSLQDTQSGFDAFEEVVTGALRRVGEMLIEVGVQGAQAIAGFVQDSISAAGDFEAGMNQFAAAAGGSLETAGLEVQDFSELFINLGKDLPVSTAEVQQAAIALVKGGINPAIIAAGGLESSLQFAAAAGMGLEAAAELGVKVLSVFAPVSADAAEKTAFLAHAQDLLVKAAGASTSNVDELGDAMLTAAGQAQAIGLSVDEFTTSMGLLANTMPSAAEAGTSFKNFLTRLAPSTQPAKDAMAELGLMTTSTGKIMNFLAEQGIQPLGTDLDTLGNQFTEFATAQGWTAKEITKTWDTFGQSRFFDEMTGEFVGVDNAAQLLQDSLAGLSDVQRVQALSTIFGNDASAAAMALAKGGSEAYQAFAEQMAAANGVQSQAEQTQIGYNTALQNFGGSVEALQISLGTRLLPVLTIGLDLFSQATGVVIGFTDAIFGNQEAFAALSPPLQEVVVGIQQFADVVANVVGALMDAGPMSQEFAESLGLISPALPPIISALQTAASFLQNNWQSAVAAAGGVMTAVLAPGIMAGAAAFGGVLVAAAPVIAILAGVGLAVAALQAAWESNFGGIQEKTAAAMAAIQGVIQTVIAGIQAFWEDHGAEIVAFAQQSWQQVQEIIGGIVAIIAQIVGAIFGGIQDFLNKHGEDIRQIFDGAWQAIRGIIGGALDLIQGIVKTALELLSGDFEGAWDQIQITAAKFVTHLGDVFMGIWNMIEPGIKMAWDNFVKSVDTLGSDVISGIVRGIGDNAGRLFDSLKNLASNALDAAKDALGIQSPSRLFADEVGEPIALGVAQGILNETQSVMRALDNLSKEAVKALADLAEKAASAMDEALSGRVGLIRGQLGANDYLESLYGKQDDAAAKIADVEAANKEIDAQIADLMANEGDPDKIADLNAKKAANSASLSGMYKTYTDLLDLNSRTQDALKEAQAQANEIGKTDATAANDYLNLRKNQIAEIAKYEQRLTDATSEGARERARANLDAVKQAQELELQQLRNSTSARAREIAAQGDMEATGNAVVDGIIKGIWDRSSELANALGMAMSDALDAARKSLGIRSPSLVFAQEVGMPIAEGIGLGIEQAMGAPMAAINSLTSSLVRPAGPAVAGRGGIGQVIDARQWNYSPSYGSPAPNPSSDFAAMRVLATAR